MAITKLMHMKEAPGCPHNHLRNAINYILDVKHNGAKTEGGTLVGGNSGIDHKEILKNFLETKQEYGKTDGRQGYHFVISFAKGETDKATAYDVMREFCEQYLGDNYDYVFAVHNDKEHMHGHIIFNSVSRTDGYKYHYKKGDWERIIQPITDKICIKHGLESLKFENERVGVSYASWATKKDGYVNKTHITCADVDYAIQKASTMEEFYEIMKKMNYQIRKGYSRKDEKSTFTFIFTDEDGKEFRRKSNGRYTPSGYSPEEIAQRIRTKEGSKTYEEIVEKLSSKAAAYLKPTVLKGTRTYTRLYQAVSYYKLPNPFAIPAYQVRRDMMHIDKLIEECRYLKENPIKGEPELKKRAEMLEKRLEEMIDQRRKLYGIRNGASKEELAMMEQYEELERQMLMAEENGDDRFEEIEDEMQELEKNFPPEMLEVMSRIQKLSRDISGLRKEKKVLERILKTEAVVEQKVQEQQIRK